MLCIIPARGGSRRIPMKNIRMFHGKPIIAYSIETALATRLFAAVIVSTDHDEIAEVARHHGATVHWRDPEASQDAIGTQEVAARVLEHYGAVAGYASVIYATAPLLLPTDVHDTVAAAMDRCGFALTVGDAPLQDAGACYAGPVALFLRREPLISSRTTMIVLPPHRVCDINTGDDLLLAEKLYERRSAA